MTRNDIASKVNFITSLFESHGHKHYGENCTQLIHAISCALHAVEHKAEASMVVAAFLHDIGHFVADEKQLPGFDELGHKEHDKIGADWLVSLGFPPDVYQPIRYHVLAKRYRATRLGSDIRLSEASTNTLCQQGGLLTAAECKAFESSPYFHKAIELRGYDDLGKPTALVDGNISPWLDLIEQFLQEHNALNVVISGNSPVSI